MRAPAFCRGGYPEALAAPLGVSVPTIGRSMTILRVALRKRLLYLDFMNATKRKNPAAVALGRLGGRAGAGAVKRRGGSDYYRHLVAKRKDRGKMRHRHLNHQEFTLAAIDDIISRGSMAAWKALREAMGEPEIREKILRVCAAHASDPAAQRHHFWRIYAQAHRKAAA
jgi:hypothetical protein